MGLDRITQDPDVMGGKPCLRGMRVTVGTVVGLIASGRTNHEILAAYPYLEEEDIRQAVAYDAMTPVPGIEELVAWFGYFPSFHDAEVESIILDRSGPSRLAVRTWDSTDQVDARGYYVHQKHALVTFVMEGIESMSLEGFNEQNALSGISLDRIAEGYELVLDGIYGVDARFQVRRLRIELKPTTPTD